MDLKLQGMTALVSGAHRGTGEMIAARLVSEGASVLVHGPTAEAAAAAAGRLNSVAVHGDLTTDEGGDSVLEQLASLGCTPDILVNNMGSAARGRWGDRDSGAWLDMYQVNVLSAVRLIDGLLPAMRERGWGRIIQLGTSGSRQPRKVMPQYYGAKGALNTLMISLAQELSGSGVTVNMVSPGLVLTDEVVAAFRARAERAGEPTDVAALEAAVVARDFPNPAGRIARREEVAAAVAFLASPWADSVNGHDLVIDGGASAHA